MINLLVNNTTTFIEGEVGDLLKKQLRKAVGYRDEAAIFRARNRPGYDGIISTLCYGRRWCKCAIKKDGMHFPSGLLKRVGDVLEQNGVPFTRFDQRPAVERNDVLAVNSVTCESRDYQIKVVDDALKLGRGIIKLATGGGKTGVAAQIIAKCGVFPFIFFVTSADLLKQAVESFEKFILHNNLPLKVGMVGGGYRDIQDVTVMTVQTAVRALDPSVKKVVEDEDDDMGDDKSDLSDYYEEVRELIHSCKGFIADEIQHWASKTCQIVSDHAYNARYRWGLSATPWRDKGDDLLIDACFGKAICDISASFLIDRGYLVPPTIYFMPVQNMKKEEFDNYDDGYKRGIMYNDVRNAYVGNIARSLVNDGRMVLILCKNIAHGELLEDLIPGSRFINGSHSGTERDQHIAAMKSHKAPVTIASTIFDEGIDVRPLDAVILAGGGKSKTRALQRVGRAIRPYTCEGFVKKDAVIVDFFDEMKWFRTHSNTRRRIYETEPRFTIKKLLLS
jgi:superfamily II DNA or RNA helicase